LELSDRDLGFGTEDAVCFSFRDVASLDQHALELANTFASRSAFEKARKRSRRRERRRSILLEIQSPGRRIIVKLRSCGDRDMNVMVVSIRTKIGNPFRDVTGRAYLTFEDDVLDARIAARNERRDELATVMAVVEVAIDIDRRDDAGRIRIVVRLPF
jgi:hypothetical protein